MYDGEDAGDEDPPQGWKSHDATGLLHLLLVWHLLPSREQEHGYRQRDSNVSLCGVAFYCGYGRLSEAKVKKGFTHFLFGDHFHQHVKFFFKFFDAPDTPG